MIELADKNSAVCLGDRKLTLLQATMSSLHWEWIKSESLWLWVFERWEMGSSSRPDAWKGSKATHNANMIFQGYSYIVGMQIFFSFIALVNLLFLFFLLDICRILCIVLVMLGFWVVFGSIWRVGVMLLTPLARRYERSVSAIALLPL